MKNIYAFNTIQSVGIKNDITDFDIDFSYEYEGQDKFLTYENENDQYAIKDNLNIWSTENNLNTKGSLLIKNVNNYFGQIISKSNKLKLVLEITCKKTNYIDYLDIANISYGNNEKLISFSYNIEKNLIRDAVDFNFLFLVGDDVVDKSFRYANIVGTRLGTIYSFTVQVEGDASSFPVFDYSDPKGQLWTIEYLCDDPYSDQFEDVFKLRLNTAHNNYPMIDITSESFNNGIYIETISQAISFLIELIKKEDININDESILSGSLASQYIYFDRLFELESSNSYEIFCNIRDYIKRQGGI